MYYILLFFLCFFFTLGFTPLTIKYLKKAQVIDLPGGRHIHKTEMPRMGGLLVYLASSFVLIYFSQDLNDYRLLIISSLLVFLIGVLDDTLGVSYQSKIIFQILVAFMVTLSLLKQYGSLQLFGLTVTQPVDSLIMIFFITGAINAVNFLDGVDGLVCKSSILWFSTILILSTIYSDHFLTLLSTCLIGSIIGFLKYNSYPARVFLGDTGSLSIGFYLVISSLITSSRFSAGSSLDLTFPIILLSVPLFDAIRVIVKRLIGKRNPFLADKTHIHHVLLQLFPSQRTVVNILEILTALSCILAIIYATGTHTVAEILTVALAVLIVNIKSVSTVLKRYFLSDYIWKTMRRYSAGIQKVIFGVISLMAMFFIVSISSSSSGSKPDSGITLILLFLGVVTFCIAYFRMKNGNPGYELFILLNMIIFLIITNMNKAISSVYLTFSALSYLFSVNDFYVLFFLIIVLLLSINTALSLHLDESSTDTVTPLLLAIILSAVLFIPHLSNYNSITLLLGCLIIYIWVRWVISFYKNRMKSLSFFSFSLPFGLLVKLLVI